jgi:DivIVA domain-containing protein
MMWFFAVLIVLALGGVAMLAAGRGAPLAPVYDDRPDSTVPAEGPLSGSDLRRVRFSLAFRGYRMSEVDALLDRLAVEREQVDREERPVEGPGEPSAEDVERPTDMARGDAAEA